MATGAAGRSPPRRCRSQEALEAVEFVSSDGGTTAQAPSQFSPCKPPARALRPGAGLMAAFDSAAMAAAAAAAGGSPCGVADLLAPSTASQPSSATSSLAAALADLQVASRQSSENDLGDQRKILAALGLPAVQARLCGLHSRGSSGSSDEELLAAVPAPAAPPPREEDRDSLCSPQLMGVVKSFDSQVLKKLTPIKTRSRTSAAGAAAGGEDAAAGTGAGSKAAGAVPSPAAPFADSLVSPFHERQASGGGGMRPKQLQQPVGGRPVIYHSRSSSITAPGAYNPYDLTAAALSSEFRSPAKSLHSPFPSSSRTYSTTVSPSPSQWGSASYRASAYRAMAAQQALAAQKDDEPDYYVSVPGVRRQQSLARGSSLASVGSMGSATAAAAAATAAAAAATQHPAADAPAAGGAGTCTDAGSSLQQHQQQQQVPTPVRSVPPSAGRLERQPTLGSGTAVHGFKGLFRSIIVGGSAPGNALP